MTTVYTYDPVTKEYKFQDETTLDPVTGEEVMPGSSTTLEPPEVETIHEGRIRKVPIFEDGAWVLKPDYRHEKFVHNVTKEPFMMTELGELPEGYTYE